MLWKARPTRLQYSLIDLPDKGSYPLNINDKTKISLSFKSPAGWMAIAPEFKFSAEQQKLLWRGTTDLGLVTDKLKSLLVRMQQ